MIVAKLRWVRVLGVLALCGCDGGAAAVPVTFDATFEAGADGWSADFADYPVEDAVADPSLYALDEGLRDMPVSGGGARGFLLDGTNRSDDLWMALVSRLEGLAPDTRYRVRFEVDVASNAASGCVGIGGAPGESVTIKAGGSPRELVVDTEEASRNRVWVTPDKGIQTNPGADSVVLGNVATGLECPDETWVILARTGELEVDSDAEGRMTLFVGSDSGYEGRTTLYYDRIRVTLTPSE